MSTTESSSLYNDLDQMSPDDLLMFMNLEDQKVAIAVRKKIPQISAFVTKLTSRMKEGGRLFYIGAGTSGRLGVVDASECPPTFGVDASMVTGIIAGGDTAIRKSVENAEDNEHQAWKDLEAHNITQNDTVVGIAASGRTPYVVGGLRKAREHGLLTSCITCNEDSPCAKNADYPIEVVVGPEFITGSTRLKAGTAQKLVLNMISTATMIGLGKVKGNKMVDMQLSNTKLKKRAVAMIMDELQVDEETAFKLLQEEGSVRKALDRYH